MIPALTERARVGDRHLRVAAVRCRPAVRYSEVYKACWQRQQRGPRVAAHDAHSA